MQKYDARKTLISGSSYFSAKNAQHLSNTRSREKLNSKQRLAWADKRRCLQGHLQTMWKFHKVKLFNFLKIGKYGKEIGGKSGKLSTNREKSKLSHSIDTVSTTGLQK